jgi:hypothetical protein
LDPKSAPDTEALRDMLKTLGLSEVGKGLAAGDESITVENRIYNMKGCGE